MCGYECTPKPDGKNSITGDSEIVAHPGEAGIESEVPSFAEARPCFRPSAGHPEVIYMSATGQMSRLVLNTSGIPEIRLS
jgi:hypothetical protein